jgi:LmbE family N-acetylglucosaminyl deacetylase
MPTEAACALFLFAHQDDEFGVFQRIADCRRRGLRVACAYFTDGATGRVTAAQRNGESRAVLARLGVAMEDIAFAGEELGIGDAHLPQQLAPASRWLQRWLDRFGNIDSLHVTAWEGGHHDHDALHALAVGAAEQRGLLERTWQYPLYQAKGLPGPLFRVLAPLPENGPATRWTMPWGARALPALLPVVPVAARHLDRAVSVRAAALPGARRATAAAGCTRTDRPAAACRPAVLRKTRVLYLGPDGPGHRRLAHRAAALIKEE